jgi:2-iminobutanoate/2-iminopropanoate deaminase
MKPTPVDPPELQRSPAFAQGMIVPAGPVLYVGGQQGRTSTGALLDGVEAQTKQALRNVLAVLAAAGTDADHVAKLTIYLSAGSDAERGYAAAREVWGDRRTAVTVLAVPPARPDVLVEIEAVATVPVS